MRTLAVGSPWVPGGAGGHPDSLGWPHPCCSEGKLGHRGQDSPEVPQEAQPEPEPVQGHSLGPPPRSQPRAACPLCLPDSPRGTV